MEAPPPTVRKAKLLRRQITLPEVLVWTRLRGRALEGLYFRRQHPIGPYVLDFYCDEVSLAVEVDGKIHGLRQERDEARDEWLALRGVRTLRLRAEYILKDMDGALNTLLGAIDEQRNRHKNPPP